MCARRRRGVRSRPPIVASASANVSSRGPVDLVELADVAGVDERGGRDVGDVVDVDERLGDVGDGQRHGALDHLLDERPLGEVLGEHGGAHDRPLGARSLHESLGAPRAGLAAARQQDEAADAVRRPPCGRRRRRRRRRRGTRDPGRRRGRRRRHPSTAAGPRRRSCQSNGGGPVREPMRTVCPATCSRAATRRPVLPVPPVTRTVRGAVVEVMAPTEAGTAERVHGSISSKTCVSVYDQRMDTLAGLLDGPRARTPS